jgi:hypothetical protein
VRSRIQDAEARLTLSCPAPGSGTLSAADQVAAAPRQPGWVNHNRKRANSYSADSVSPTNFDSGEQEAPSFQPNCLVGLSSPAVFMCYIHTALQVLAGSEIPLSLAYACKRDPELCFANQNSIAVLMRALFEWIRTLHPQDPQTKFTTLPVLTSVAKMAELVSAANQLENSAAEGITTPGSIRGLSAKFEQVKASLSQPYAKEQLQHLDEQGRIQLLDSIFKEGAALEQQDASDFLGDLLNVLMQAAALSNGLYQPSMFRGEMLYFTQCTECGFIRFRNHLVVNITVNLYPADSKILTTLDCMREVVRGEDIFADCPDCAHKAFKTANPSSKDIRYLASERRYVKSSQSKIWKTFQTLPSMLLLTVSLHLLYTLLLYMRALLIVLSMSFLVFPPSPFPLPHFFFLLTYRPQDSTSCIRKNLTTRWTLR